MIRGILLCAALTIAAMPVRAQARDGQHDFDFEIGEWHTHLERLTKPLTGSTTWVEYDGTTSVRSVLHGKANLVELTASGEAGHFQGLNLRLYNPASHQWSLNFANAASGIISTPTIGEFRNGRGEFYDQETYNDRAILVRFVIIPVARDTIRFEQSFSDDGGKTWELNWVATDTRVPNAPAARKPVDANHDFDNAIGVFETHIKRLEKPLTGSKAFVNLVGTITTNPVFDGRGNLEQIEINESSVHLLGLTLRLYDPASKQWRLYWANSATGTLAAPTIGAFHNGVGEFYSQDELDGRTIFARETYSQLNGGGYHFEGAYSGDGGRTWEPNFTAVLTRKR